MNCELSLDELTVNHPFVQPCFGNTERHRPHVTQNVSVIVFLVTMVKQEGRAYEAGSKDENPSHFKPDTVTSNKQCEKALFVNLGK